MNNINHLAISILRDFAYEIAINAFEHGHAGTFGIKVENDRVIFTDDGIQFDYSKLLETEGRGGKATMEYVAEIFRIAYRYDKKNILELFLPEALDLSTYNSNYTISFDAKDIFGRGQAEGFTIKELSKVPADCEKIIVDICGHVNPAISCSFAMIDMLLRLKNENQKIVIYLPENLYYKENIIDKYSDLSDVDIKIKE